MEKPMEKTEKAGEVEVSKVRYRGVKAMPFIIGNETFEKLGTIGVTANLMVYLSSVFHMKHVSAATLINVWTGMTNTAPLVGAFISDAYLGRYKTLGIASISSLTGMFFLMLTAAVTKLHPPHCGTVDAGNCQGPNVSQLVFLLCGFGFLVVGAGGIRPCNLAFGADQFDPNTESGKRGINSFFNWYYFTFTFAMMISLTLIVYVQDNVSWAIGFGLPTILMFFSCAFFFIGTRIYVKVKPEGSPLHGIAQVIVAAIKKRHLTVPDDPKISLFNPPQCKSSINSELHHTEQFRFLDKACIKTLEDYTNPDGSPLDPWRLSTMQNVEEVKCLIRVVPIWVTGIIFCTSITQQTTYAIVQAQKMDRHLGPSFQIPSGSFNVIAMIALTLWLPFYDRILVPFFRRFTGKEGGITLLQRMGIGIFLSTLTMIVAGLVEDRRRQLSLRSIALGGNATPFSALWLAPQFTLCGLSEAFNAVGQIEFYYKQFPENMRSIAGSFFFCGIAGGSYLSGALVAIIHQMTNWLPEDINQGKLDYFYYVIAVLGVVNFAYFLGVARWYRYKSVNAHEIDLQPGKAGTPLV